MRFHLGLTEALQEREPNINASSKDLSLLHFELYRRSEPIMDIDEESYLNAGPSAPSKIPQGGEGDGLQGMSKKAMKRAAKQVRGSVIHLFRTYAGII